MLDPKLMRTNIREVAERLAHRGFRLNIEEFDEIEAKRKQVQKEVETLQNQRNTYSKQIGILKSQNNDTSGLLSKMEEVNRALRDQEGLLEDIQIKQHALYSEIPNLPDTSVPVGKDERDNQISRTWGSPSSLSFPIKDHVSIGESLQLLNFETAAKITGSRFAVMYGKLAKLHRALIQFMLDTHTTEHGYQEVYVPYIVNDQSLFGTGQLPKFEEDLFRLNTQSKYYLIPTAEVPVTNIWRDEIIEEARLPIKYVCHTPCFRSEAGSYGKDTRGMIRQHQFEKVELVQITKPDQSWNALETLTQDAERILQKLELPYHVVTLCSGDLGFASAKTYDLEVWLPSQKCYREISSCSNFLDFQSRRMKIRWKNSSTGKVEHVHTLNGSGLAVGRTLVAIMESYQQSNSRVAIPKVLQGYFGGALEL